MPETTDLDKIESTFRTVIDGLTPTYTHKSGNKFVYHSKLEPPSEVPYRYTYRWEGGEVDDDGLLPVGNAEQVQAIFNVYVDYPFPREEVHKVVLATHFQLKNNLLNQLSPTIQGLMFVEELDEPEYINESYDEIEETSTRSQVVHSFLVSFWQSRV